MLAVGAEKEQMDFSMSENGRALSLLLSFSPSLHMTMRSLGWWRWQPIVQSAFSEPLARLLLRDETSEYEGGRKNGRGREKERERAGARTSGQTAGRRLFSFSSRLLFLPLPRQPG